MKSPESLNILITGGAGFIGSHIVESVIGSNNVTILDNFYSGSPEIMKSLKETSNLFLIQENISNPDTLEKAIKGMDVVFHLAAVSTVAGSIKNPRYCIETNIQGTVNILEACRKHDARLIFPSSIYVYGEANYLPVDELHPKKPKNPYALSKWVGELYCQMFHDLYSLPFTVLRLCNVYGPRDQRRVIPIFIEKGLAGEEITVFGGKQILDFTYIKDIVQAFLLATTSNAAIGEAFNIGAGKGVSLLKLAETIVSFTGGKSKIKIESQREYESQKLVADISKAKKILGYSPRFPLEKGLKLTIEDKERRMCRIKK